MADEKSKQDITTQAKVTAEKEMEVEKVKQVQLANIKKEANIVKADGGLTSIDKRILLDLALNIGSVKVALWTGRVLSNDEIIEKIKAGGIEACGNVL